MAHKPVVAGETDVFCADGGIFVSGENFEEVKSDPEVLARKFAVMLPLLNERQKRLYLATEADALGRGGVSLVSRLSGVARSTIHDALDEHDPTLSPERVRKAGGGRKAVAEANPAVVAALEELVSPETRGDPESPLRWTTKSTRHLAKQLTEMGHRVSHRVVADLLRNQGYSLQALAKTKEGGDHPDRDQQFEYINSMTASFQHDGEPVISVDCKKKELVGNYKNGGREWQPSGEAVEVNVYDFVDPEVGKALPYGVYDVTRNEALVNVGRDHDTASFAVESIRRWWHTMGTQAYPDATRLLINADGGGSNGYRVRLWKAELAVLANETGLEITVCHFPPGTSKWNKIEHRLFSFISMNWRGQPLVTHEVIVSLIGATTTRKGLQVVAHHDFNEYPKGFKVSDQAMKAIPLTKHAFHGEWNYTITPS
jgi:transposase